MLLVSFVMSYFVLLFFPTRCLGKKRCLLTVYLVTTMWEMTVHLAVADAVYGSVLFCVVLLPLGALDEI